MRLISAATKPSSFNLYFWKHSLLHMAYVCTALYIVYKLLYIGIFFFKSSKSTPSKTHSICIQKHWNFQRLPTRRDHVLKTQWQLLEISFEAIAHYLELCGKHNLRDNEAFQMFLVMIKKKFERTLWKSEPQTDLPWVLLVVIPQTGVNPL